MAGFLTHYLFGMESCEKLPDNYIKDLITGNNHPFLTGLQGFNLLSFDPHRISKRGLSYQTASGVHNQEYGAFFNNMLDYIENLQGHARDVSISFMAGFLCFYALSQAASPYIMYICGQHMPVKSGSRDKSLHLCEVETSIDTVLVRTHCHMEPSQLNFEALTFVGRKDIAEIEKLMRYTVRATYHCKISASEISNGLRGMRRQIVCLQPKTGFRKIWIGSVEKTLPLPIRRVYTDFQPDNHDYMNTEGRPWYPYPGCSRALHTGFNVIFDESVSDSLRLLEDLDSCISWGMSRDTLIGDIIGLSPYADIM